MPLGTPDVVVVVDAGTAAAEAELGIVVVGIEPATEKPRYYSLTSVKTGQRFVDANMQRSCSGLMCFQVKVGEQ